MKLLYTRYNRHRLPQFQIETSIFEDQGKRVVIKKALAPEARSHIREIARNYAPIKEHLVDNLIRLPDGLKVDKDSIQCDYVGGSSLEHMLFQAFLDRDAQGFLTFLDEYTSLLKGAFKTVDQPVVTDRLKQVFGLSGPEELNQMGSCFALSLIDPVFENIFLDDGRYYMIDNEWVFDGCLPVSFTLFRSLFYFYQVKYADFDIGSLVSFEAVLDRCSLSPEIVKRFQKMENHFQAYVFGEDRCYRYKSRYIKPIYPVLQLEVTVKHQSNVINHQYEVIQGQQKQILQMTQSIKDKDQLIKDKDQVIADVMNSRGWQFVQKVTRIFNRLCPPGTRRRRIAARLMKLSESAEPGTTQ